jgi:LPXTG-motif cell wall-anchored protein
VSVLSRSRERRIANAVIADPKDHTTIDNSGAVRSVQAANVDMPEAELDSLWQASSLERLARTYWWYLSRISLGLIRVHYSEEGRSVVFITKPFVMLSFHPPEYEMSADRGVAKWRIRDGLLVGRRDDGYLEIDVRRCASEHEGYGRVHVEVEVASFYPRLARPFKWFYVNTQSRIHVIVTHGFLKRLARLELEESAVGRFSEDGPKEPEDINVGSTPWLVVAGLAAVLAGLGLFALRRFRR